MVTTSDAPISGAAAALSSNRHDDCADTIGHVLMRFISQGQAFDWAVGLLLAGTFSSLVGSFLRDVLLPPLLCAFGDRGLRDSFVVCRYRHYLTLAELEHDGVVERDQYATWEEAVAAGVDLRRRAASLDEAQQLGLNTLNYGRFLQLLIEFFAVVGLLAVLIFGVQRLRCRLARRAAAKVATPVAVNVTTDTALPHQLGHPPQ
jgi:large-conductance mechanosensitive channel